MKLFASIFALIMNSCFNPITKSTNIINEDEPQSIKKDYQYHPKQIVVKQTEYQGSRNLTYIGEWKDNLVSYSIVTEFRVFPVADGMRGASFVYVISENLDTLCFDAEMPDELPIDIYKNHFVFLDVDSIFKFCKLELHDEIICFSEDLEKCFLIF